MKSYLPKGAHCKYEGTAIARAIASGDVSLARFMLAFKSSNSWNVSEIRAIVGACFFANETYNINLKVSEFL